MLNRTAIILRCREPFVRWINEAGPQPGHDENTVESDEQTVYLIDEVDSREDLDRCLGRYHRALFELEAWYTDKTLWPKSRTLKAFRDWIDVDYHTVVVDLVDGRLIDDEV